MLGCEGEGEGLTPAVGRVDLGACLLHEIQARYRRNTGEIQARYGRDAGEMQGQKGGVSEMYARYRGDTGEIQGRYGGRTSTRKRSAARLLPGWG